MRSGSGRGISAAVASVGGGQGAATSAGQPVQTAQQQTHPRPQLNQSLGNQRLKPKQSLRGNLFLNHRKHKGGGNQGTQRERGESRKEIGIETEIEIKN